MNVRKLMARLNPTNIRFDVGRGGVPDLTTDDIRGALGIVRTRAPFACEIFCLCWWPDGAARTREWAMNQIAIRQRAELDKQWRSAQVARLELHIAEENACMRNVQTFEDRRILAQLRAKDQEARGKCWPAIPAMYPVVRIAALEELCTSRLCHKCAGEGLVMANGKRTLCETCGGPGTLPKSDRARAERIGKDESTYRAKWRGLYEWTFDLMHEAEITAGSIMAAALSPHEPEKCGSDAPAFSE